MLYQGKFSRPGVAERRLRRPMTSATGTHNSARYRGANPCQHVNTSRHSLNVMRCGMSSQCWSTIDLTIEFALFSILTAVLRLAICRLNKWKLIKQMNVNVADLNTPVTPVSPRWTCRKTRSLLCPRWTSFWHSPSRSVIDLFQDSSRYYIH